MHTNFRRRLQLFGFAALCLLFGVRGTWAQDNQDDSGVDPPDRVARLSYTQGTVSLEPAGAEDWTDAAVNRPMTSGDKLWVDARSRAELQVGSATIFLDQNTAFSFSELNDEAMQMRITGGAINIRVRRLNEHETVEVDTPNAAIGLTQPGEYHVAINDAGDATVIKVRSGQTSIANGEENFLVSANQQATLTGTDRLAMDTAPLGPSSSFEDWAHDRVRQGEQSQSARYVSPEVVGYQDLDEYGSWSSEPEYGEVWVPSRVDVDWAPYRFGRWMWVAPWGWTWVDNAPWGFAPFHYGRWAHVRDRWCWVPGPIHARPVYAPALVAWVGGRNASVSVSIGGPGIGWFPLAPREVYVPGYRVSPRYMHNVNVSNTTIVNNTYITNVYENRAGNINYANRNAPHAVTVVQRDAFTRGQPVAQHLERVDERQLRTFQGRDAVPRIAPTRESVLGAGTRAEVRRPPAQIYERPSVARYQPPASRAGLQNSRGVPENNAAGAGFRNTQPATPQRAPVERSPNNDQPRADARQQNHMLRVPDRIAPPQDNPTPVPARPNAIERAPVDRVEQRRDRPALNETPAPSQLLRREMPSERAAPAPPAALPPPMHTAPAQSSPPMINRETTRSEPRVERPEHVQNRAAEQRPARPPEVSRPAPQAAPMHAQPAPPPPAPPHPAAAERPHVDERSAHPRDRDK